MGLGSVQETGGTFLSIAGGFIWNRKADKTDPDYGEQKFTRADKTEGVRAGARYADLTGKIVGVKFQTHPEFGENINISVQDESEEIYIVSISTNNRYSQDFMKCLLNADLSIPLFIKPYDFIDKEQRRAQGILFKQNGEKINLRIEDPAMPSKDAAWFKSNTTTKKEIRRFFEDLSEWFVAEVEEKVCSKFTDAPVAKQEKKPGLSKATTEVNEASDEDMPDFNAPAKAAPAKAAPVQEVENQAATPLKMKKVLKAYLEENYEGRELPALSKEELIVWYNLSLNDEELPFDEESENADVPADELSSQLDSLLSK